MKNTGYPATSSNIAYGSMGDRYKMIPEPKGGDYSVPSGFISTTLDDLLALHEALRTDKLMKRATRDLMVKPYAGKNGFSLGWQTTYAKGHPIVRKNGAGQGFESFYRWMPDEGSAVIVVVSRKGDGVDVQKINDALGDALLK